MGKGNDPNCVTAKSDMQIVPEGELRVWLDDDLEDRAPGGTWIQVTTAQEAIHMLETGRVVELSLDHDLGDDQLYGRGVDVVDFLAQQQFLNQRPLWPRDGITLHTANPEGRDAMARSIHRYAAMAGPVTRLLTRGGKPRFTFGQAEQPAKSDDQENADHQTRQ